LGYRWNNNSKNGGIGSLYEYVIITLNIPQAFILAVYTPTSLSLEGKILDVFSFAGENHIF
jgi:hypothetical protein